VKFNASNDAAALLVELYGLEQGLKIPLAEAVVALALDDFEKYRTDCIFGEYLQQNSADGAAVDQYAAALELGQGLTMAGDPGVDALVISGGCVLELDAAFAQGIDGSIDVIAAERYVLDALALVFVEVFLDLTLVVLAFIDGYADFAAGRGEGARKQPGLLALDAEVTDFPEVEQPAHTFMLPRLTLWVR
jgi:hypothetical protein